MLFMSLFYISKVPTLYNLGHRSGKPLVVVRSANHKITNTVSVSTGVTAKSFQVLARVLVGVITGGSTGGF